MPTCEKQAEEYAKQVMELAGKYLSEHSEKAAETLEGLYSKTICYYQKQCKAFDGVLAIHAHILALWNVNEHFRPSEAYTYASAADACFTEYLASEVMQNDLPQQQSIRGMLQNVWLICAYCDYSKEELSSARAWLNKIPADRATAADIALMATILLRLTMEKGVDEFLAAYALFHRMDEMFTETPLQLFEEDIIRTAYGFYALYYTHDVRDSQVQVPYDPDRAVAILMRAYPLFTDPQQREYMQENINMARKHLAGGEK